MGYSLTALALPTKQQSLKLTLMNTLSLPEAIEAVQALEHARLSCWQLQYNPVGSCVQFVSSQTGFTGKLTEDWQLAEFSERLERFSTLKTLSQTDLYIVASYPVMISLDSMGEDFFDPTGA